MLDILIPYFKTGLENNEFCMWVCWDPLRAEEARTALSKRLRNLDNYIKKGQIEIVDYSKRYTVQEDSGFANMKQFWVEKEKQAFERGFEGLRLAGNTYWLEKKEWNDFKKYEEEVDDIIRNHKMIALCPYSLDKCGASEIIDVIGNHKSALIKREGKWEIIESSKRKKAEEEREELLHNLAERAKELNCLYGLSKLIEKPGISLEEIFKGAINLIPPSWQYPDITCARIVFEDREFKTDNFKITKWVQSADIKVHG